MASITSRCSGHERAVEIEPKLHIMAQNLLKIKIKQFLLELLTTTPGSFGSVCFGFFEDELEVCEGLTTFTVSRVKSCCWVSLLLSILSECTCKGELNFLAWQGVTHTLTLAGLSIKRSGQLLLLILANYIEDSSAYATFSSTVCRYGSSIGKAIGSFLNSSSIGNSERPRTFMREVLSLSFAAHKTQQTSYIFNIECVYWPPF